MYMVTIFLDNGEIKEYKITDYEYGTNRVIFKNRNRIVAVFMLDKIIGFEFISK